MIFILRFGQEDLESERFEKQILGSECEAPSPLAERKRADQRSLPGTAKGNPDRVQRGEP
jgi:hypothetical protein